MKPRPLAALIAFFVFALAGFLAFKYLSPYTPPPPQPHPTSTSHSDTSNLPTPPPSSPSNRPLRYLDYSPTTFAAHQDKNRILYFHANWCPICRPLNQAFQTRSDEIPEMVVIFKVDYDTATQLKNRYAVTYQHTFVQVDSQANQVAVWNGGDFDSVISHLQSSQIIQQ